MAFDVRPSARSVSTLRKLAFIAADFRPETLPAEALARAQATWKDAISVMTGGAHTSEAATIAATYAKTQPGHAGLIGGGTAAPAWASFANAVAASASDYEDGHAVGGAMHPASPIIPAIIAAAGPDTTLLQAWTAQIAGYEVALRAGHALLRYGASPWFHASGLPGAMGAAVARGVLAGRDPDLIARAAHTAFLHGPFSTGGWPMIKESIGWGAMTGYVAYDLAALGFMGLPDGYDPHDVNINPESPFALDGVADDAFVASMGQVFESQNAYFKPFAACRWTHSAADALQCLLRDHAIAPDAIARIIVQTHKGATNLTEVNPKTIEHGQYSHEMVLSAIALTGQAGYRQMSVAAMADPARLAMAQRVVIRHDPALDPLLPAKLPARVIIELHDGRRFEKLELEALGANEHPLSPDRLQAKWMDLLTAHLAAPDALALLDAMDDPQAKLLDVLAPLFAPKSPAAL